MKMITPIYDRDQTDIDARNAKAFFNVIDWIRINNNTQVVNNLLVTLFGRPITFTVLTAPTITTIPTAADINLFLANIERLRLAAGLPMVELIPLKTDWLEGTSAQAPDFEDVNLWERTLTLIYINVVSDIEYQVYCGVAATGQPRFYQHRWRHYAYVLPAVSPVRRGRTGVAISGTGFKRQNYFRRY